MEPESFAIYDTYHIISSYALTPLRFFLGVLHKYADHTQKQALYQ